MSKPTNTVCVYCQTPIRATDETAIEELFADEDDEAPKPQNVHRSCAERADRLMRGWGIAS